MTPLWKLLNEVSNADIDRGYIIEILVDVIQKGGLSDIAIAQINEKWGAALEEYRKEVEEEKE